MSIAMIEEPILLAAPGGLRSRTLDRSECLLCPGALVRAAARVRRLELDRRLAGGADPTASTLLAARAAQLSRAAARRRLAVALERFALVAQLPIGAFRVHPARAAVDRNRDELIQAAASLRQPGLLYARGIAQLELILIDGTGPAYTDPSGEGLALQLQLAAEALSG
ncbi:MAG: hypothetical protein ACYC0H_01245 [Solirubrobacteraceae bacterium]